MRRKRIQYINNFWFGETKKDKFLNALLSLLLLAAGAFVLWVML